MKSNIELNQDTTMYGGIARERLRPKSSFFLHYIKAISLKEALYLFFKRFFDIFLSFIAIIVLFPFFLIIALAIKIDSPGPVIYSQKRVGKDGKQFIFYKFRSMCQDADKELAKLKDKNEADGPVFKIAEDPRVTRVGKFIRKNMSIVGPRPPLPCEVKQYTVQQMHRLDVKPGLTCYWQISGRSNISFQRWVELDLKYIKERSLWTDLKIIVKTVPAVLTKRGAY